MDYNQLDIEFDEILNSITPQQLEDWLRMDDERVKSKQMTERTFQLEHDLPNLPRFTTFKLNEHGKVCSILPPEATSTYYEFDLDVVINSDFFTEILDDTLKKIHIERLVKLAAKHLDFTDETMGIGTIYLDPKRPFGFSGEYVIINNILEAIGIQQTTPDLKYGGMDWSDEERQYAKELFQVELLPAIIKKLEQ